MSCVIVVTFLFIIVGRKKDITTGSVHLNTILKMECTTRQDLKEKFNYRTLKWLYTYQELQFPTWLLHMTNWKTPIKKTVQINGNCCQLISRYYCVTVCLPYNSSIFNPRSHLHITFSSEDLFIKWLRRHPFDWQFLLLLYFIHFMINFSHQTEVGNLEEFTVSDENISCSEVSMN